MKRKLGVLYTMASMYFHWQ